ncbi:MAG: threonine--tRNA ligase [Nanoarchaeota archaeon]|nr:threonine--tRNA ligase [Nanoarchaeota archaeon]
MVTVTLPDGSKKEYEGAVSVIDVAKSISEGLARDAVAAKLNGILQDTTTTITTDTTLELLTSKNEESLSILRHSAAHILAQAVLRLYPKAKRTIGPATENGFFYDFDMGEENLTEKDLEKIETEMKKIVKEDLLIEKEFKSFDKALDFYKDNEYKQEIINSIKNKTLKEEEEQEGEIAEEGLQFYKQAEYSDLCKGPHIPRTGMLKAFKLERITRAYWKGDATKKQLYRVYGTAFWKKSDMDAYYTLLDEAKKRDHRKLGREMNIFTISELVGAGLPLFKPNGAMMRKEIEDYLWDLHKIKGYKRVWTPHLAKIDLYKTSGHYDHYKENFQVKGKDEDFMMKPMNCPHHMQIFADNHHSYKDMPVRYFEPATVYRDELSGALSGLARVRSITQDDGHLFCRVDQIKEEVSIIVEIIKVFYEKIGMLEDYWVSLSVRDPNTPEEYLGSDDKWEAAETALEDSAKENNLPYKRIEGEAAFYGPKLDFMFKDAIGREWQLATIQCDFNLPERFDLFYTNEKDEKEKPVVIHRAIAGSLERFMSVITEHYAGKFPLWLSPVQIKILNIADRHIERCKEIETKLIAKDFRVETNFEHLTTPNKIRLAQAEKVNYIVIIGDKDIENKTVSVRSRDNTTKQYTLEEFITKLEEEKESRK